MSYAIGFLVGIITYVIYEAFTNKKDIVGGSITRQNISTLYACFNDKFNMQTKTTKKGFSVVFTHIEEDYKLVCIDDPFECYIMYSSDGKKFNNKHHFKLDREITIADLSRYLKLIDNGKIAMLTV